jgi:ArsR family transcriptional regulator
MDDSSIIEQLRALGDPVRFSIVQELRGGPRCACDLARVAGVSATLLSHHLKVLRAAGLITGSRRGRWIDYTLNAAAVRTLVAQLHPAEVDQVMIGRAS